MPVLIDSHCHLDFPDFAEERDAIVSRALDAGVKRMVTISTRVKRFDAIRAIAEAHGPVFCSVGTHPHNALEEQDVTAEQLVALAGHPKCVAIGEAGLDYFYDKSPRDEQAKSFRAHIAAARETQLPLVIHARDADEDMAAILTEETGDLDTPGALGIPGDEAAFWPRSRGRPYPFSLRLWDRDQRPHEASLPLIFVKASIVEGGPGGQIAAAHLSALRSAWTSAAPRYVSATSAPRTQPAPRHRWPPPGSITWP